LRGKEPKEISLKNLSKIIHARVEEIVQLVFSEIKSYGYENPQKKLIAGIVLTGGGSELKHIKQLVEYITGIDTRIGYPNEHLAGDSNPEISSPLFATAVGLVMESEKHRVKGAVSMKKIFHPVNEKTHYEEEIEKTHYSISQSKIEREPVEDKEVEKYRKETSSTQPEANSKTSTTADRFESSFLGNFFRKIKEFIEKQE
jgi:cell division protein FtsA